MAVSFQVFWALIFPFANALRESLHVAPLSGLTLQTPPLNFYSGRLFARSSFGIWFDGLPSFSSGGGPCVIVLIIVFPPACLTVPLVVAFHLIRLPFLLSFLVKEQLPRPRHGNGLVGPGDIRIFSFFLLLCPFTVTSSTDRPDTVVVCRADGLCLFGWVL